MRSYRTQGNQATPGLMKWLLLASLCTGGVLTAGKKMLQELKTLYVLNAHEYGAAYLDSYRSALRTNQESFIEDLRDDNLHSALLFFIAHALHYSAITMGRGGEDLRVELDGLDGGVGQIGRQVWPIATEYLETDFMEGDRVLNGTIRLCVLSVQQIECDTWLD